MFGVCLHMFIFIFGDLKWWVEVFLGAFLDASWRSLGGFLGGFLLRFVHDLRFQFFSFLFCIFFLLFLFFSRTIVKSRCKIFHVLSLCILLLMITSFVSFIFYNFSPFSCHATFFPMQ